MSYTYDLAGRHTNASDASASVATPATTIVYATGTSTSYDALNRPIGVSWTRH